MGNKCTSIYSIVTAESLSPPLLTKLNTHTHTHAFFTYAAKKHIQSPSDHQGATMGTDSPTGTPVSVLSVQNNCVDY